MPAKHLTILHYPPQRSWICVERKQPRWKDVSAAIERMDDDEYPALLLSWKNVESCFDDQECLNMFGGIESGFALTHFMGEWSFEDPIGGDEEVRLWQSDQGYFCQRKNIIIDLDYALKLVRIYFEAGSYEALRRECLASGTGKSRA